MTWSRLSRHERGYGTAWTKVREYVMRRDAGLCKPCERLGVIAVAQEVDHIIPKAKGGTDDPANLEAICVPCHRHKTAVEQGGRVKLGCGVDGWPV